MISVKDTEEIIMKEISIRDIKVSAPELFDGRWALLTAGDENGFNSMTVSWGALGEIWGKDAAFVFVRRSRYTYEFIEKNRVFTLSFYDEKYKPVLGRIFGSKSGRDTDKAKEAGFTPLPADGAVTYEQAEYTAVCRVMAAQDIEKSSFIDEGVNKWYDGDAVHKMYIAEMIKLYENDAR